MTNGFDKLLRVLLFGKARFLLLEADVVHPLAQRPEALLGRKSLLLDFLELRFTAGERIARGRQRLLTFRACRERLLQLRLRGLLIACPERFFFRDKRRCESRTLFRQRLD